MKNKNIYPVRIPFTIPVSPEVKVERFVYVYLIDGEGLYLIDTGVAGCEDHISDELKKIGRSLPDVDVIILTHSHPDHIGSASVIRRESGAEIWAHSSEREWIEDIEMQGRERPVPGFAKLVSGPVAVDRLLADGDILSLCEALNFRVLHTPGHSSGSISLYSEETGILFSGDAIPQPGEMPIYDDVTALSNSLLRFAKMENLSTLYSSWCDPIYGQSAGEAIREGMRYVEYVHEAVMKIASELKDADPMEFCRQCVIELGLPPFAANPLVIRSLIAHGDAAARGGIVGSGQHDAMEGNQSCE